jgi:hypothetical protein
MSSTLKNRKKNSNAPAGYGKVVILSTDHITVSPAIGTVTNPEDNYILTTAPTLASGKGFVDLGLYAEYNELKAEIKGEAGSKTMKVMPSFFLSGDAAKQIHIMNEMAKGEFHVIMYPPDCNATDPILYLGCDCRGVDFSAAFDSSSMKSAGKKGTTFTGEYYGSPMVVDFTIVKDSSVAN